MATNSLNKTWIIALALLFAGSQLANAQYSLFSDVKAKRVGDIITVVLKENTFGSSTTDSKLASSSNGQADGTMSGNFLPFEPVFGAGASVRFDADQKNQETQRQLLEGYVSVQIVEVTPTGGLIVEGKRLTEVNGETHEMSITGVIRQYDIDGNNQVLSYRIANANISYQKMGGMKNNKRSKGLIKKVVIGGITAILTTATVISQISK
jgi:flagellar L-ring protein precursor FlgH